MARSPKTSPALPTRITRNDGAPFRSEPAARLALDRREIDDEAYDYIAEGGGVVAVLKGDEQTPTPPIGIQTKSNGDPFKDEPTSRLAIERRGMDPDSFTYDPQGAGIVASPIQATETPPDAPVAADPVASPVSEPAAPVAPVAADPASVEPAPDEPAAAAPQAEPDAAPRTPVRGDDDPHPDPTDAQKDAGNFRMRHVRWNGLDISVETAKGQERSGTGGDGERWAVVMPCDYGYIRGTVGNDGDHIDVYLGDALDSDVVVIVNQIDPETRAFDEQKVLAGNATEDDALRIYRAGFSDNKGDDRIGSYTVHTVAEFKAWLADGNHKKPTAPIKPKEPSKASLADFSTKDIHAELIKREGVDAIWLGPEDRITKSVSGPAWVIVNRD